MWHCYYCRASLSVEVQLRNRLCPGCGSDIHCCKNCAYYDERLSTKCQEPDSPWVSDRNKQNSCAFFEFRQVDSLLADPPELASDAEKAKEAFRALFRSL